MGPAEISVAKDGAPTPAAGAQSKLSRFDPATTAGAAAAELADVPEQLWLPEATEVIGGLEDDEADTGSFYLIVPAEWQVAADAFSTNQDVDAFADYFEVDVINPTATSPAPAPSNPEDPGPEDPVAPGSSPTAATTTAAPATEGPSGRAVQAVLGTRQFSITIMEGTQVGFSVVSVKWTPFVAPPAPAATPSAAPSDTTQTATDSPPADSDAPRDPTSTAPPTAPAAE